MAKKSKTTLWLVVSIPLLLLIVGFFFIYPAQKKPQEKDFAFLMGKNTPVWQYVHTDEDNENYSFFKNLYEKGLKSQARGGEHIPKVFHFIWIGPKNFPSTSIPHINSWIAHHPEWTFKFWTDRRRPLPHPKMQLNLIENLHFLKLLQCFEKSDNYAEKADLLRYEILFQEGGVYVDHDVKCLHSFDSLNEKYDFYCGLELPSATCLSSSIHSTNNLIGAVPNHPILKNCLNWLDQKWDALQAQYPGHERDAVIARVANRTFSAFADSVKQLAGKGKQNDMVFPAFTFNAPDDSSALLARHLYAGTWFENETPFEKMTRERLMLLSKKANKTLLLCGALGLLNLLCITTLAIFLFKNRKTSSNKSL